MKNNFKRNLFFGFGVSLLILIASSIASFLSIKSLLSSNSWVNHTQEVIYNLNSGTTEMLEAQTSMRGFLITGRREFLDQYNNTESRTDAYLEKLRQLTGDNKDQQAGLKELVPLKEKFFQYLEERVEEKLSGKTVFANDLNTGKKLMDDMREVFRRMEIREQELLVERIATSEKYGYYSSVLIVWAAVIAILITVIFSVRTLNDFRERARLHDELKKKDVETAERINVISGIASQISQGNYAIRIDDDSSDALGSVGVSLNNMAGSLEVSFNSLAEKEWLQTGVASLSQAMIGEKPLSQLTKDIIDHLVNYTGSQAGVMYLATGDGLMYAAGYNYIPEKSREYLRFGQGLIGEAVLAGKPKELKSMPEESIKISYALGEVVPGHVIAFPLIDGEVAGAVELASFKEFSTLHHEFLNSVGNNIGIALKAAQNRKRVQELLDETQAQSEELRVQHTELESMNAELETQTEKLQASEEELRVQQEELQQTNEELAERSVLLEEKNLEIQKKSEDLEISTRYKSEFLANMSHELRTPLNSILLLSRLLSENNDRNMNEEQIEFAKVIQSSGNGLLGLIDEILDLSKIEAGKMELEFLDIPVAEVTNHLRDLFKEVAKEKNIEFKIIIDEAPLVIRTDKMRLEQILKNLLSNAIKFTPEGSVTLEVKKSPADARLISFTVKDTGIGIAHEKQPLIFEAFQQADGSTRRKYGGTGLGLSISRELAKLMRGEISLKSKVNEGSEFTLTIPILGSAASQFIPVSEMSGSPVPVIEESGEAAQNQYISSHIPESVPDDRDFVSSHDKTILIVEDDTNFAKSLLEFTRKRGYKGIVTVRGDHALNLALTFNPVGILLDIQLPVMSGWEVLEELKGNKLTRHIPVHIMSSHKVKQESLLKGAVNFLDKPVAFERIPEIFKKIEQIVNEDSQKVLIIEDNPKHAKALALFLENYNISSEIKSEVEEGINVLQQTEVNCVILDMGVPDKQAYDFLENIKRNRGMENLPVIVFTGKSLSMKEELKIRKYADSIVVKTAHSYQRMLDEVSLFLHIVEENKKSDGKKEAHRNSLMNDVLNNKTVLVVDDDVRNIYSLTKALELLKMNVITAIDGTEAIKALEQHPEVDIVLLDMMMPNMDGYETARIIRGNQRLINLPVIAVTAKAMTGDREKCINAGASDYITKPVDVDQLLSLLRVWLFDQQ